MLLYKTRKIKYELHFILFFKGKRYQIIQMAQAQNLSTATEKILPSWPLYKNR